MTPKLSFFFGEVNQTQPEPAATYQKTGLVCLTVAIAKGHRHGLSKGRNARFSASENQIY